MDLAQCPISEPQRINLPNNDRNPILPVVDLVLFDAIVVDQSLPSAIYSTATHWSKAIEKTKSNVATHRLHCTLPNHSYIVESKYHGPSYSFWCFLSLYTESMLQNCWLPLSHQSTSRKKSLTGYYSMLR